MQQEGWGLGEMQEAGELQTRVCPGPCRTQKEVSGTSTQGLVRIDSLVCVVSGLRSSSAL